MRTITIELQVPDWANFVAVDQDGTVIAYEKRPEIHEGLNTWDIVEINDRYESLSHPNWRESLVELSSEQEGR